MTLKEIALEILEKYHDSEISVIYEYSGAIYKDLDDLSAEIDRYTKQIEIMDMQNRGGWIPVTARPMDNEERLEWSEKLGYDIEYNEALIYTSQLPDDGQEVLTCDRYGNVKIDTFESDPDYGCYFDENGDMDGIVAWMPLPEPYKGGDTE